MLNIKVSKVLILLVVSLVTTTYMMSVMAYDIYTEERQHNEACMKLACKTVKGHFLVASSCGLAAPI